MKKALRRVLGGVKVMASDAVELGFAYMVGNPDVMRRQVDDEVIYWPTSKRGVKILSGYLGDRVRRRRFGYAIPLHEDEVIYRTLRLHSGLSIGDMATMHQHRIEIFKV